MFDIKFYVTYIDPETLEKCKLGGFDSEEQARDLRKIIMKRELIPDNQIHIVERIDETIKFGDL